MGCHTVKAKKVHDAEDVEQFIAEEGYVHYLSEYALQWYLVVYSLKERQFITLTIEQNKLMEHCESVTVSKDLYCSGGTERFGGGTVSGAMNLITFNKKAASVKELSRMKYPRFNHCFVCVDTNHLCVIGGTEEEDAVIVSCELYDIGTNKWSEIGNLIQPKVLASACTLNNRFIYVFGGRIEVPDSNLIERMDFIEGKRWETIECDLIDLNSAKFWCSQISKNEIILVGDKKTWIYNAADNKIINQDEDENTKRLVPDKREEIKTYGDTVVMILESSGNVGVYSLTSKKWTLRPHIMLGF